ncbi:hypothetical protein Tco_0320655 [Tanacetum coccineum]
MRLWLGGGGGCGDGSNDGDGGDGNSSKRSRGSGSFEESGEDYGLDSNEDEVFPNMEEVSLVDGVFDGAFGGDGDEDVALEEEAWVEAMKIKNEEDEDDGKSGEDWYKEGLKIDIQKVETASGFSVTLSGFASDGVRTLATTSGCNRHKETLEDSR